MDTKRPVETTCSSCGDQIIVPADENPEDTLCVPCAEDEQAGYDLGFDDYDPEIDDPDMAPDLNPEGDPTRNGAW